MKNFFKLALVVATIIAFSAACEHKDLCWDHMGHASRFHIFIKPSYDQDWQYANSPQTPDWSTQWNPDFGFPYDSLRPEIPAGVRVLTSNLDSKVSDLHNISADGGRVYFSGPRNSLLLYNNDTEYIIFNDLSTQTAATATTRTRTRSTYVGNQYSSEERENTVAPPDMLYARYLDKYEVEEKVVPDTIPVELKPLVYTYFIRYEVVYGMEYLGLARGALSGMAGSVYLHNGHTTEQVVTLIYDCNVVENFGAQAFVQSFGVPNYPNDAYTRADQNYALNLEVRLRNGEMMNFDFDVTDQVKLQPHGGVIEVTGIEIPDSIGLKGGSGFDIFIEGWGEYVDVDLPLGGNKDKDENPDNAQ